MKEAQDLAQILNRIDRKGYKAYNDIEGSYEFTEEGYVLHIDHVQGDPFASPSKVRITIPQEVVSFPDHSYSNKSREVAVRDFIARKFHEAVRKHSKGSRGSGKSGRINIDRPGQEILERTSAFIDKNNIEVRFTVGLPAFGRKIAGNEAKTIFFTEIPLIVNEALIYDNLPHDELKKHYETNEDADSLRSMLDDYNLIAFVSNESILPRISGVDPRPMEPDKVIPFQSPDILNVQINLPNKGEIEGMGIKEGITLIVGGGFHGKSTLLQSIEQGIYNHIPGDGREFVVANPDTIKIRSEDRRSIKKVDISPFINNLPMGKTTEDFSTEDASGSTSQAANIIEAIEAGSKVLLIDEDTSATNFMIRDNRMQQLIQKEKEPITPFIDKVKLLYEDHKISTILVMGGSGDYFDVADHVVGLDNYVPHDLTDQVNSIKEQAYSNRSSEGGASFGRIRQRIPTRESIDPSKGKKRKKIKTGGRDSILFGTHNIDLSAIEQITDASQVNAISEALVYAKKYMDGEKTIPEILDLIFDDIEEKGLNVIGHQTNGNYAMFRKFELAAALNRLRTLKIKQKG